jgi:hypothetical protein
MLSTPDFTPQAVAAFVILLVTNGVILFGLTLAPAKEAALEALVNGVAVVGFLVHDAIVRHGRATGNTQR